MDAARLNTAVDQLRAGHVVAVATESSFGLLVDANRQAALDLLFKIKGRKAEQAVALMVADFGQWRELVVSAPPLAEHFATCFWPGPLTLVLQANAGLDPRLLVRGAVGVRIAGASAAADIVSAFGGPVTATSANLAGEPPCTHSLQVLHAFRAAVDAGKLSAVEGQAPGGPPSTLVRVRGTHYETLRAGAISAQALEQAALGLAEHPGQPRHGA
jgi:L-threonylcarbamoyladenylate synthase